VSRSWYGGSKIKNNPRKEKKMKKVLYFILIIAELFVGALLMSALWNSSLYIPIALAVVALVAMVTWQLVRFAKAKDPAAKRKSMLVIALAMLIPTLVFAVTYIVVAIAFIIAFV
jgi:hypothetical protein